MGASQGLRRRFARASQEPRWALASLAKVLREPRRSRAWASQGLRRSLAEASQRPHKVRAAPAEVSGSRERTREVSERRANFATDPRGLREVRKVRGESDEGSEIPAAIPHHRKADSWSAQRSIARRSLSSPCWRGLEMSLSELAPTSTNAVI